MTPEERDQFEKTLADLKLPEQPAPDDVTPMDMPEEAIPEVAVDLPDMPSDVTRPSPVADVQAAFDDGAGGLAAKPVPGNDEFAKEFNEGVANVIPREPIVDVPVPPVPQFDADRHEQGASSIPQLEEFMREMEREGKLDKDGFLPEQEDFKFRIGDQAEPHESNNLGDGAMADLGRKTQANQDAIERGFRVMATILSQHTAAINQLLDGLLRGQS